MWGNSCGLFSSCVIGDLGGFGVFGGFFGCLGWFLGFVVLGFRDWFSGLVLRGFVFSLGFA